jgi:hypothetical protein
MLSACLYAAAAVSIFVPTTFCCAFVVSGANVGGSRGKITMSTKRDPSLDSPSSDRFRIGYLSDIEGHWDYFL